MKLFVLAFLSAAIPATAFAAEPAMISKIGGHSVTWEHGDRSSPPKIQTLLAQGDRISAGAGSFADIQYMEDNCTVRVSAGRSVMIGAISPCAQAAAKSAPKAGDTKAAADDAGDAAVKIEPAATSEDAVRISAKKGSFTRLNRGSGLVDANVGDGLTTGDEVYAGPNSEITLYFKVPQCEYTVPAQTVYRVTREAPCKRAAELPNDAAAAPSTIPPAVIGGGLAVIVGGGAAAIIIGNKDKGKDKDKPATPD